MKELETVFNYTNNIWLKREITQNAKLAKWYKSKLKELPNGYERSEVQGKLASLSWRQTNLFKIYKKNAKTSTFQKKVLQLTNLTNQFIIEKISQESVLYFKNSCGNSIRSIYKLTNNGCMFDKIEIHSNGRSYKGEYLSSKDVLTQYLLKAKTWNDWALFQISEKEFNKIFKRFQVSGLK